MNLPTVHIELNENEMSYVDGGKYFSAKQCKGVCAAIGMSPAALVAAAGTATVVSKVIKYGKVVGGPVGWAIGGVAAAGASAVSKVAWGFGKGAVSNKGVNISFSTYIWDLGLKVEVPK